MASSSSSSFAIVKEEPLFKRYLQIKNRTVQYPDGRLVDYDLVFTGSNMFVTVLPFFTKKKTFSIIREYTQGSNSMCTGFACGGVEKKKHSCPLDAAKQELDEELRLKDGQWIELLPKDHPGILEVKWGEIRFIPYLVLDPVESENPAAQDLEECIERLDDWSVEQLEEELYSGNMHVPSQVSGFMALKYLRQHGYI